jgi:hypothetical protein
VLFLAGVVALLLVSVRRPDPRVAAAAAAALLFRLVWTAPAFVHDGFHGPLIVNGVLGASRGIYGENYGPGSFAVLGFLSSVLGRSAEGVMAANALVSALATFPLASAAEALRRRAGLHAALLWAGSPLVARLAHSEDAHITGVAFAFAGVAFALQRRALPAVLATVLAMWTRQSFIVFAPIVAILLWEARAERWVVAAAALGLFMGVRAATTAESSDGRELAIGLSLVPAHPGWIPGFLASHPLLSIPRLPFVVPLLFLAGAVVVRRWTLLSAWVVLFLLSLASAFPSVGVRWSFRLPVYTLSIVVGAAGAAWLQERLGRGVLVATALLSLAGTATLELRAANAEFVEYTWLRDRLRTLDRPLIPYEEGGPDWRLPSLLADRAGLRLAREPGAVMLDGIGCYAWDVLELAGTERAAAHQLPGRAEVERIMTLMLDPARRWGLDDVPRPEGPRFGCARILQNAVPYGEPGPEIMLEDSPPTAVFSRGRLRLRLVEWRGP